MTPPPPPAHAADSGVRVDNLRFSLGSRTILEDLHLAVGQGEFVCLLGPSGSGKTTLLRLLAGLETPSFGRVAWNGRPVAGQGLDRGVVFEDCGFFPWLTLMDNMTMAIDAAKPNLPSRRCHQLAREYLSLVGLDQVGHKHPLELSRGMRQRGAIARALAMDSPALLLDDPFCVLDPHERAVLQDLLQQLPRACQPRKTVVLATHDLDEAFYLADRIIGLAATPGPIIIDAPLAAPRPRDRSAAPAVHDNQALAGLRRRIEELYHQDDRRRMAAQEFFGLGEGI